MRGILRELQTDGADVTVIDMEAGLEHLKRGTPRHTDALLVVAEPYFRSAETALRLARMGSELGIPWVSVVANKVRDQEEEAMIRELFGKNAIDVVATVPFDESIVQADRRAAALVDVDPESPAVKAVERVADALAGVRPA